MKTATIIFGDIRNSPNGMWIEAYYRGKTVHNMHCHRSEMLGHTLKMQAYIENRGFTHYKNTLNGKAFKL